MWSGALIGMYQEKQKRLFKDVIETVFHKIVMRFEDAGIHFTPIKNILEDAKKSDYINIDLNETIDIRTLFDKKYYENITAFFRKEYKCTFTNESYDNLTYFMYLDFLKIMKEEAQTETGDIDEYLNSIYFR